MNLRNAKGKVPVHTGSDTQPFLLVDFPTFAEDCSLFRRRVKAELLYKYWSVLQRRSQGMTLVDAGRPHYITKQRVRQIEAKFLRLFRESYFAKESSSGKAQLETHRPGDGSR